MENLRQKDWETLAEAGKLLRADDLAYVAEAERPTSKHVASVIRPGDWKDYRNIPLNQRCFNTLLMDLEPCGTGKWKMRASLRD